MANYPTKYESCQTNDFSKVAFTFSEADRMNKTTNDIVCGA